MEHIWTLANPLTDVEDIVEMAQQMEEQDFIVDTDPAIFRRNVTVAATYQLFDRSREFLAVCRDDLGYLLGYCWFDRGGYTTYSTQEISNAKFHHVRMSLSAKQRIRLVNEMIDQHLLWAASNGIPLVCSTSILADHKGFMHIHAKRGFHVKGSYAWIKTQDGIKWMEENERTKSN